MCESFARISEKVRFLLTVHWAIRVVYLFTWFNLYSDVHAIMNQYLLESNLRFLSIRVNIELVLTKRSDEKLFCSSRPYVCSLQIVRIKQTSLLKGYVYQCIIIRYGTSFYFIIKWVFVVH